MYGEQIGWLSPEVILRDREVLGPFFRRLARLRHALRPYLSWGEMARPPRVEGDLPDVTADWAWHHYWPVTDRALQRGAWKSRDGRLALLFVNVTGQGISARLKFDGTKYGFARPVRLRVTPRTEDGSGTSLEKPGSFDLDLPAYGAIAYEISAP